MNTRDSLGDRMKGYEAVSKTRIVQRMPAILRLDGKAFHTFTRGLEEPWDIRFVRAMWAAAKYVCGQVQGCQLAYVQSDEISLLIVDYKTLQTEGWFDHEVQKMVSVCASLCGLAFYGAAQSEGIVLSHRPYPAFDARVFNVPREDVANYFVWRQQDAVRNSIQMAAQSVFSPKQLHEQSQAMLIGMLQKRGIEWNDYPTAMRRGACVVRNLFETWDPFTNANHMRPKWVVNEEVPIFTEDRNYVERFVNLDEANASDEEVAE